MAHPVRANAFYSSFIMHTFIMLHVDICVARKALGTKYNGATKAFDFYLSSFNELIKILIVR